jgi:hypothetical protein
MRPCPPRRPLAELVPQHGDLLVGGADGDDPIGELAGALGVDRSGGGDVDRHRLLGAGVELGRLEGEVLAVVLDDLAAEQLVDDLDRLEHHRAADADLRPLAADDVLVERLTGTQAQPEAAGVHGAQRGRRVGDDRGVVAEAGAGDRRAEGERGALAEGAHEAPREGALALLRRPRVEVLADLEPRAESGPLRLFGPVEQVGGVELLEHRRVSDLRHGARVAGTGARGSRPDSQAVCKDTVTGHPHGRNSRDACIARSPSARTARIHMACDPGAHRDGAAHAWRESARNEDAQADPRTPGVFRTLAQGDRATRNGAGATRASGAG